MCGLKPGDEVVCVGDHAPDDPPPFVVKGRVYTVTEIFVSADPFFRCDDCGGALGVVLAEVHDDERGFCVCMFRKVQRRDLTEWPSTATDFEEPKRAPAKRRERA